MKRVNKIALAAVGTVLVVGSIAACSYHRDPEHRAQWLQDKVTRELELNEAQQAELQDLGNELNNTRMAMKQQLGDDRVQLLAMLEQPTLDQPAMLSMIQTHTRAVNDRAPEIVAAMADFYDGLTAEQQTQVRKFLEEHRGPGRHRHH